jgi:hypothetical protein
VVRTYGDAMSNIHWYQRRKSQLVDEAQAILDRSGGRLDAAAKAKVTTLLAEATDARDMAAVGEQVESMRGDGPAAAKSGFAGQVVSALSDRVDLSTGRFDVKRGASVEVSAAAALGVGTKAPNLAGAGTSWQLERGPVVPLAADRRFIYANLPTIDAGDATSVDDFRVTAGAVAGNVDRALTSVAQKATLAPTIVHVVAALRQQAVVLDAVPVALLAAIDGLRRVLDQQGRTVVQQSLDDVTYAALAANAPAGNAGATLPAQIRTAVGAMRAAGHDPDLLIVDPTDGAGLDLFEDTGGSLVFATRDTGESSPLFGLRIVESRAAVGADPLLVDTSSVGVLYLGGLSVDLDPYNGAGGDNFRRNLVDIRFELSNLAHIRDATGAFRIGV